jgi:hypothetical protein
MSGGLRVARRVAPPRASESEPRLRRCTTADGRAAPCPAGAPVGVGPEALLALQRAVGNQAVTQWLRQAAPPAVVEPARPAVQRQITDDQKRHYNFALTPPAWFSRLAPNEQREVLEVERRLKGSGRTKPLRKVLEELVIDHPEEAGMDEHPDDGSFTVKTPKRAAKSSGKFHSVYPKNLPLSPGRQHHEIACSEPGCALGGTVKLDTGTYHEMNQGQRPPICHPLDLPAAHTGHALDSLVQTHHPNPAFFMISPQYPAAHKTVQWDLPTLTAGHTSCNLSHKDTPWNSLSPKKQKKVMDEVINHLISRGMLKAAGKGYAFI